MCNRCVNHFATSEVCLHSFKDDYASRYGRPIWSSGTWLRQWCQSIMIPLPKKGNLRKCTNYRTISLISHPSKVMLRVLLNRLTPCIEDLLSEEQARFRASRSTVDQIFNIRTLAEHYGDHQRPIYNIFIDFRKAFD